MEQIRTFIAIELDEAWKAALNEVQAQLKESKVSRIGRWVAPDSIHLTLKFLGNVPGDRIEEIKQAMSRACRPFAPFRISLAAPGCFPDARRPRVVWIGIGGDLEPLMQLQRSVDSELNSLGFAAEKRGFQPHLTLARIRDNARPHEREEMGKWISRAKVDVSASMMVQEVSLMRSDLQPAGAIYTCLAAILLGEG